jgi:hypothetical protein
MILPAVRFASNQIQLASIQVEKYRAAKEAFRKVMDGLKPNTGVGDADTWHVDEWHERSCDRHSNWLESMFKS